MTNVHQPDLLALHVTVKITVISVFNVSFVSLSGEKNIVLVDIAAHPLAAK